MKRMVSALLVIAVVAVAAWWRPWTAPETASADANVTTVTAAQAGYRVTIDPNTGELKDEPAPIDMSNLPASLQNALSTSSEGLELVDAPGGGQMVDLRGRFQNTSVARVEADGTLEAPCLTNEAELESFTSDADNSTTTEKE
jgi:hypothetical protein